MQILYKIFILLFSVLICGVNILNSQNALEVFGKNKIQYNDDLFDWWIYETKDFVIYWYGKSRPTAQFCIEIAETENNQVQKLFEYHLRDKIELVVYADASDLSQSNINLDGNINEKSWSQEPKIKDQKLLIYFDGDHEHLRNLLRSGITQLYFNSMFSGTALQDVVQKVVSFRLPEWFEKGLIKYLANGWKLEDQISFYKIWNRKSFKKFSNKNPELAGQSFWNYLISTFGEQAISNWLYMTRIQKDIQTAARLVFSLSFTELQSEWFNFYNSQSVYTNLNTNLNRVRLKSEEQITNIQESFIHPELILSTQQNGKARIRFWNKENNKLHKAFKSGTRSKLQKTDLNYPIYFEDSASQTSYILYEKKNRVRLNIYNSTFKLIEQYTLPEEIQGIYSAKSINKDVFIFSGNTNGYSDIMYYSIKSRQFKKITDDIWDDLDVQVLKFNGLNKIVFRSNRPFSGNHQNKIDSVLPLGRFAIYSIVFDQKQVRNLETLEFEIPMKTIRKLNLLQSNFLINIDDQDRNRWLIQSNNALYEILPEQQINILSSLTKSNDLFYLLNEKDKYYLNSLSAKDRWSQSLYNKGNQKLSDQTDSSIITSNDLKLDTSFFQSQFGNPPNILEILSEFDKKTNKNHQSKFSSFSKYLKYDYPNNSEFNSNLAIAYRNRFWLEELSSTVNNDLLFSGLNTFSGTSAAFEPPPFGILLKTKATELFENYSFEGGLRVPTSFNGLEAYLLFDDRKKRFDHTYGIYYKSLTETSGSSNNLIKKQSNTFLINHQMKYAFDHYRSIRAITTLRNDHVFYLSTNKGTLYDSIDNYHQRIGTRIEYVFDDALEVSLNIKNGWQTKFYFEISKRFDLNPENKSKWYPGALMIAGFDIRNHLPVLSKSVFSNRCYTYASFGHDRMLYHVGGTENWLIPEYENQTPLPTSGEYVYSALATEVRGYGYGARKAGSVFGFSSELRIPFLQYLINQNWKNSLLRNFQLILFLDGAYVWDGIFPDFKNENYLAYHAENNAVIIDLNYYRNPFIAGTGFGLRTALFGYFIRFDYAWKINKSGINDPDYNFSLGLDF
jgi:hypothetical protein